MCSGSLRSFVQHIVIEFWGRGEEGAGRNSVLQTETKLMKCFGVKTTSLDREVSADLPSLAGTGGRNGTVRSCIWLWSVSQCSLWAATVLGVAQCWVHAVAVGSLRGFPPLQAGTLSIDELGSGAGECREPSSCQTALDERAPS